MRSELVERIALALMAELTSPEPFVEGTLSAALGDLDRAFDAWERAGPVVWDESSGADGPPALA